MIMSIYFPISDMGTNFLYTIELNNAFVYLYKKFYYHMVAIRNWHLEVHE